MATPTSWRRVLANAGRLAGVALLLLLPAYAVAAAPAPVSPAAGASVSDGASMTFSWTGTLLGDADAKSRAYFRVQVAEAASVPAGRNADWGEVELELITNPGAATTSLTTGAPVKGNFRWRVCAMGVRDADTSHAIEQLDCSANRTFAVTAAPAAARPTNERMVLTNEIRTTPPAPDPAPEPKSAPRAPTPKPAPTPTRAPAVARTEIAGAAASEAVAVSPVSLDVTGSGGGLDLGLVGGAGGSLIRGLTSTIPGLGLPMWALILPMLTVPFVIWFGKSTQRMFDLDQVAARAGTGAEGALAGSIVGLFGKESVKSGAAPADGLHENAA